MLRDHISCFPVMNPLPDAAGPSVLYTHCRLKASCCCRGAGNCEPIPWFDETRNQPTAQAKDRWPSSSIQPHHEQVEGFRTTPSSRDHGALLSLRQASPFRSGRRSLPARARMEILPTTARRRRGAPDSGVSRADSPRALGASAGWLMGRPVIGGLVVCFSLLPAWAVIIGSNCVAQRGTSAPQAVKHSSEFFIYLICYDFRKIKGRFKIFDKCTSGVVAYGV
jgi:hypothetical protein